MEAFTHAARTLGSLIEAQGPELLDDRRRTRSFLADLCPEARAPRAALDAALALGRARLSSPDSLALSESLARATALHPAVTRWAVGVLVALLTGRPLPPPPRVAPARTLGAGPGSIRLLGHGAAIQALALLPGGEVLASAADPAGEVILWSLASRRALHRGRAPEGSGPISLGALPGGKGLAVARGLALSLLSNDGGPRAVAPRCPGRLGPITTLAVHPGGHRLVTGHAAGSLQLWSTDPLRPEAELPCHRGAVTALAWLPGGRLLLSGGTDHQIRSFDGSGAQHARIDWGAPVRAMALEPSGRRILVPGQGTTVGLLHPAAGARLRDLPGLPGPARALAWTEGGRTAVAACGGSEGVILRWVAHSTELRSRHPAPWLTCLIALPGGGLAAGDARGTVTLLC